MNSLEFRKNKVSHGNFRWNKTQKIKLIEELEEDDELDIDLFEELLDELKSIKRKKTLERFIKQNRELINELASDKKQDLLHYIRTNFY